MTVHTASQPALIATKQKQRLWMMDWGCFAWQVIVYLKEKGLMDALDLINVEASNVGMKDPSGKPQAAYPFLKSRGRQKTGLSLGTIMEYLEDLHHGSGPNMRGDNTVMTRAHVQDCMTALNDAVTLFMHFGFNSSSMFTGCRPQDVEVAKHLLTRAHELLAALERIADKERPFLVPTCGDRVTMADCATFAVLQFAQEGYGVDLVSGHPRLAQMYRAFEARDSAVWDGKIPALWYDRIRMMSVSKVDWSPLQIATEKKAAA